MPVLEVDVQPLATGRARLRKGEVDQARPDAASPSTQGDERVKEEAMNPAVADHIHEPDEFAVVAGPSPTRRCGVRPGRSTDR